MKWTLKLERIDEAGNLHSTTVAYVERPELTSEADLGLTHDDGKYLLRRVQAEVAQEQVRTESETEPNKRDSLCLLIRVQTHKLLGMNQAL